MGPLTTGSVRPSLSSGTTAVVGVPYHTVGANIAQGAAYVFTLSGGTWSQTQELTASDGAANDLFGDVAISGSTIMVGASFHWVDGNYNQGAVYVFTLSGGTWSQTQELTASDGAAYDYFGDVVLSGSTAVVSAPFHMVYGHRTGCSLRFHPERRYLVPDPGAHRLRRGGRR